MVCLCMIKNFILSLEIIFNSGFICGETAIQSYSLEWQGGVLLVRIEHMTGNSTTITITQARCTNESNDTEYDIEITCSRLTYLNISCLMDDHCNGTTVFVTINGVQTSSFHFLLNSELS